MEAFVDLNKIALFQETKPVFDGRRNMYTTQLLRIDRQKV